MTRVHVDADGASFSLPLERHFTSLGSNQTCELYIDHEEVLETAAHIDFRDGDYHLQNMNEFEIYVGGDPVAPEQWTIWRNGEEALLTRSVKITLDVDEQDTTVAGGEEEDGAPGFFTNSKNLIQIGVIGICAILCAVMIAAPSSSSSDSNVTFSTLSAEFGKATELNNDQKTIRRYLQEARVLDIRYKNGDPRRVIDAFELLVNHPAVRKAKTEGAEEAAAPLEARVKLYAENRLASLKKQ